jgi:hypothetical protein
VFALPVYVGFAVATAQAAEPVRVAVLRAEGSSTEIAPVAEALRHAAGVRVVGPIDRAAPRASRDVQSLGESLDVALFVVVTDRPEGYRVRVFEVDRGAYFEGTLDSPFEDDALREFVSRRMEAARRARGGGHETDGSLRLWAGLGVAVVAAGAFAALIAFGGSDDAPDSVRVDVVR